MKTELDDLATGQQSKAITSKYMTDARTAALNAVLPTADTNALVATRNKLVNPDFRLIDGVESRKKENETLNFTRKKRVNQAVIAHGDDFNFVGYLEDTSP